MKSIGNKLICLLYTVILLIGCTDKQNNCNIIDLEAAIHNVENLNLSTYASSVDYIPMGLQDSVLLGDIAYNKFFVDGEHIFVVAPGMKTIYMFDKNGKLIKSIGKLGRAKGEYSVARTIKYDADKLIVEGGSAAVIYSVEDGNCLGDFKFNSLFDTTEDIVLMGKGGKKQTLSNMVVGSILFKNNEFYLAVGDNQTLEQFLLIVDMDMSIKSSVGIRKSEVRNSFNRVMTGKLHLFNDTVNLFHGLKDTVYSLVDGKLIPRIGINYGDFQTLETQKSRKSANESIQVAAGYPFMESASMIAGTVYLPASGIVYRNGSQYSNFIYDKVERKTFILDYSQEFDMAGFINDIDGGMPFWPQRIRENKMYSFVDAGKFIDMSKRCNSAKMKEVASILTYESNPVLIEVTLK